MKFNYNILDGTFFGKSDKIGVPLFQVVNAKSVKGVKIKPYQIDMYGKEQGKDRIWHCRCKYTKTAMNMQQVEKLEQAAEAFKQEEQEAVRLVPAIQMWLASTGGFTKDGVDYVKDRGDMYFFANDGINNIFQVYGGTIRFLCLRTNDFINSQTSCRTALPGH